MEWRGAAQLHTLMEVIATLLAVVVGAMALVRFYSKKDDTFLFIGTGFLGTAFLDGYHTVVTSDFFRPFMPSDLPSLIPWSWVASRQFLSVMLFMGWFFGCAHSGPGPKAISLKKRLFFRRTFYSCQFPVLRFCASASRLLPRDYFQRPEEFAPALYFLLALFGYLKKGHWRNEAFEHWLILSLIVGLVGQAVFMSHSGYCLIMNLISLI